MKKGSLVMLLLICMSFIAILTHPERAGADETWILMGEDPFHDVWKYGDHGIGLGGNPLGPPEGDMPYLDVVAFHMKSNETMVFPRIETSGNVLDAPNVIYYVTLCMLFIQDGTPVARIEFKNAVYSNGIAEFNETQIPHSVSGRNITFHVPKTLAEAEQCLVGPRIDLGGVGARELHEDCYDPFNIVPDCYYGDSLEFKIYSSFFLDDTLETNVPPVAVIDSIFPNPSTDGESVVFIGHGEDSDGSISAYGWFSEMNNSLEYLSNARHFQTRFLPIGNQTIIFRVKDENGAWAETRMLIEVFPYYEDEPAISPSLMDILVVAGVAIGVILLPIVHFLVVRAYERRRGF